MSDILFENYEFKIKDIEGIIFDKDGTLTDSNFYWSEIIKRRAYEIIRILNIDKDYYKYLCNSMGLDLKNNKLFEKGPIAIKSRDEVIFEIIKCLQLIDIKVKKNFISDIFCNVHESFKKDSDNFIKPINSACNFVCQCEKNNLKLALLTSDTEYNAINSLKKLGLLEKFEIVIGGDSKFGNKTNGNSARFICDIFNLPLKKVIAIGDAPSDYLMSKKADLNSVILVASGQVPILSLRKFSKFSISSLSELIIN